MKAPRKPPKVPRKAPTQPEAERLAKPVMVRLRPEDKARIDALAERWDTTRSAAIARLAREYTNRARELTKSST